MKAGPSSQRGSQVTAPSCHRMWADDFDGGRRFRRSWPGPEILVGRAEESPMYAAVRRYEGITDDAEAGRLGGESFIPLLEEAPGFVCYYWIDAGNGALASLSVFDDKARADEAVRPAHAGVLEKAAALTQNPP